MTNSELHKIALEYHASSLEFVSREWIATKRAMRAEAEVRRLKRELEDLRNAPELLFPR